MQPLPTSADTADLERLITHQIAESRTIEFKRELPCDSKQDRKEWLADVTAFANTNGGDIFYGIEEERGIARAVVGVTVKDPDKISAALENLLRDGVEPRLAGVLLTWIPVADGRQVLQVHVPASIVQPHRVIVGGGGHFFARNSNGKYPLDTQQLREAFTAAEALPKRFQALHLEAVEAAVRAEFPTGLGDRPTAIASLIPIDLFRELRDLEITAENALMPLGSNYHLETLVMIEGVLLYSVASSSQTMCSYALTHRSGRIDVAWEVGRNADDFRVGLDLVWPAKFESGLLDAVTHGIARLLPFGLTGPWFLFCSLVRLRKHTLVVNKELLSEPAWRDQVHLPTIRLDKLEPAALEAQYKAFWRAFGLERPAVH